jgi:hypothetical protein
VDVLNRLGDKRNRKFCGSVNAGAVARVQDVYDRDEPRIASPTVVLSIDWVVGADRGLD